MYVERFFSHVLPYLWHAVPKMLKVFLLSRFCQVVRPLVKNGFFLKVDTLDLARLCLTKRLITVKEFARVFYSIRPKGSNKYPMQYLLNMLDASFKSTSWPKKFYETMKKILENEDGNAVHSAGYKLYKLFQEMEKSPDQCNLERGELF